MTTENLHHNTIKAVAFDMDGLMFDTEDVYWKAADILLKRRGFPYTDELCNDIMGRPPEYCFKKMIEYYSLPDDWQALQQESVEIFLKMLDEGYSAMPGLFELLNRLEEQALPKAICTSSSRNIMEAVTKRDNLLARFDFTITCHDIVKGKPDPEIYLKAADRFGVAPSEMLVLEDSVAGNTAAHEAGSPCCIVLADHNRHLNFPLATLIVHSLADDELFRFLSPIPPV